MNKLIAPDGQYYTQAADVPAEQRVFASVVYLGIYDAPENWRLTDADEKDAWEAENADTQAPPETL